MNTLSIAHLSDLHLPHRVHLPWQARLSKRQLSAWSWRRRGTMQRPEILHALIEDWRAHATDHIVITGDMVNFSMPEEFANAVEWLRELAPADRISVVPGNHDALVSDAAGELAHWSNWTRAATGWPSVLRRGEIALIGLSSARPTALLLARGELGREQLERLRCALKAEREAGRMRVLFLHHPAAAGAAAWRRALADSHALREVLRDCGAELILHGHARNARLDAIPGPHGPIPCLSVPSSSALPSAHDEGARWHRIVLRSQRPWAEVEVRRWSLAEEAFVPALHYDLAL